ncbi:TetR/AcrR family transcriptional regulator [Bacillus sp. 2205SS5-2]|uniref:TetR/AcrR family transcriptional regulator n=1 Tax=Bacillus sp. 2205SS5-2 TaxID=3109031 RepID=UPI00300699DC
MYSAFEKLAQDKKEHILSVCIEEFAKNGFEKTSTDRITNRAGISKGILFHYFKNKKNLYLYVVNYLRTFIGDQIMEAVKQVQSEDFFERMKEVVLIKQRVSLQYEQEMKLASIALLQPPAGMEEDMKKLLQQNVDDYSEDFLSKMLDKSLLREFVDPDKVIQLSTLALQQVSTKYTALFKTNEASFENLQKLMIAEIDDYIDLIKFGVYKK